MIDPIIFTIHIGSLQLALHWYGLIVVGAVMISAWLASLDLKSRGGDPEWIWDMLPWILLAGVFGARLWYVANNIAGGGTHYLENPINILNIPEGGLHIFGGFVFGGLAFWLYAHMKKIDIWLLLDSLAPYLLLGQALARPANFINQELYGPPTILAWGIPIDAAHRIPMWSDMTLFPEATTHFHPTFAYEMLWNFAAAGLLIWLAHKFEKQLPPGAIFFGWLVLAGIGRAIVETWRPDQPILPYMGISTSRFVSLLMAVVGAVLLLWRYDVFHLPFNRKK